MHMELVCKQQNNENFGVFRFFHHIWFIDSEKLCFILSLKEKTTRFRHLILFISLTLK